MNQAQHGDVESEAIDLRQYWGVLLRRRWIAFPVLIAAVLGTLLYTLRQPKIYGAVCTIVIELASPRVLDTQQVQEIVESGASSGGWLGKDYFETQFKILKSRAVATRVTERLGLAGNLKFLGLEAVRDPAAQEKQRRSMDPVALVQSRLKVIQEGEARVIKLVVEDPDPELAAAIANAFAEAFIEEALAVRSSASQNASEWLEQQLADLEGKLERSARALFEFKRQNDIVSTSWEDRQSMVSQRLTAINDALSKVRVQRAQLQARAEAAETALKSLGAGDVALESLQPVATSGPIQILKAKYFELQAECADLRIKYLERHPKLEMCEEKQQVARANLQKEIRTALLASQREFDEARQTERNLAALYEQTKDEAFVFNRNEREYVELKRAYDTNQRLYDLVLKRLKETGLAGLLQTSNVRILDRARPSYDPVRPKVRQNLLAAVVLGLLGAVALAFGVEYLDNTIRTQDQVERLGLTFLGFIPRAAADGANVPDLVVHEQPKSAVAECCRAIRTNLLFMSPDRPLKTILVTSAAPQDGKTTTAIDLAIAMADSGNRVLLLDADMRRPRIHKAFQLPNVIGLSSLVLGEAKVEEAARSTSVPNLEAITCGPVPPNPSELLHTAAFSSLLERLSQRYDRIIIDSPPVVAVSDAVVLSTNVDGTLLVVRVGRTTRDGLRRAFRALSDVKARVLGGVLNDLNTQEQRYRDYYTYGYYQAEKREKAAS